MKLNDIMEFGRVIEVHEDGSITDAPAGIYAPGLMNDELESGEWEMLDGFSGQDRYSGPIMHNSEYIGGAMERYIRESPGIYVALVSYYCSEDGGGGEFEDDAEGWAVARKVEVA